MTATDLLLLALATWRLSHLVAIEDGPGDLVRRLRLLLGAYQGVEGDWRAETSLARLVVCPLCLSVWIALALVVLVTVAPIGWPAVYVLAASGGACLLELAIASSRAR